MFSNPKLSCTLVVALWAASGVIASSQTSQAARPQQLKPVMTRGKQTFASTCAACHGLDGRGGERAPNIADSPKTLRLSDSQILRIVENGIPGTGMPAFRSLQSPDVKAVVSYLRTLQGTKKTIKLPGDAERGETIFFGKAGCSGCHMVAGQGGFIASDLSRYARTHAEEEIRSAIVKPPLTGDRLVRLVAATTRGGEKYVGRVRNEDNFSLQVQALDGTFYFVSKSDIERLDYDPRPLMPSDYGSTLSSSELNDVLSYLISVGNAGEPEAPKKPDEEE